MRNPQHFIDYTARSSMASAVIPNKIQHINNVQSFNSDLERYKDHLIILTFFTNTCSVCKAFSPHFEAIQQEFQKEGIYFARINAQQFPEIARQFDIMGVPHTIFIKNKKIIHRVSGNLIKPQFREQIKSLLQRFFKQSSTFGQEFDMMYL